jgi:chromosome segregation ATPase
MADHLPAAALIALVLLAPVLSRAQAPPAAAPQPASEPPQEAMSWDRDFDLLLELKAAPTKAQRETEERRQELEKERAEVSDRLDDLQSRLAAIQGTYTSEALLNEMLRQGVGDLQTAQANLQQWIHRDQGRLREIDAQLRKIALRAKDGP